MVTAAHCFWEADSNNIIFENVTKTFDVKVGRDTTRMRAAYEIDEVFLPDEAFSQVLTKKILIKIVNQKYKRYFFLIIV